MGINQAQRIKNFEGNERPTINRKYLEVLAQERQVKKTKRNGEWFLQNQERLKLKRRELAQTPEYKARRLKYRLKNKERIKARDRKWRETNLAQYIFSACKKRAIDTGLKFSLTLKWVEKSLATGICERTGHSFVCKIGCIDERNPWFPSIDRINSLLGYTKNNCQMVCLIYNLAKNRWTDATMLEMAKSIVEYYEKDPLA